MLCVLYCYVVFLYFFPICLQVWMKWCLGYLKCRMMIVRNTCNFTTSGMFAFIFLFSFVIIWQNVNISIKFDKSRKKLRGFLRQFDFYSTSTEFGRILFSAWIKRIPIIFPFNKSSAHYLFIYKRQKVCREFSIYRYLVGNFF